MTLKGTKMVLLNYLQTHPDTDISREFLRELLHLKDNSLSSVLTSLKKDGITLVQPWRSGTVRYPSAGNTGDTGITEQDIYQWLLLLLLSEGTDLTFLELAERICRMMDPGFHPRLNPSMEYTEMQKELERIGCTQISVAKLTRALRDLIDQQQVQRIRYSNLRTVYRIARNGIWIRKFRLDDLDRLLRNTADSRRNTYSQSLSSLCGKAEQLRMHLREDYVQTFCSRNHVSEAQQQGLSRILALPYQDDQLHLQYVTASGHKLARTFSIGLIFFSIETNSFYLLGRDEKTMHNNLIRIDRIRKAEKTSEKNILYGNREYRYIFNHMFTASCQQPLHVQILFTDTEEIRKELLQQITVRHCGTLTRIQPYASLPDYTLLYEDDILGEEAFSRYLLSFGSAALVLQPQSLQQRMITAAENVLQNYAAGDSYDRY